MFLSLSIEVCGWVLEELYLYSHDIYLIQVIPKEIKEKLLRSILSLKELILC